MALGSSFVDKDHATSLEDLGHHLFFDPKLSYAGNISCAHCHDPVLAFTDGYRTSHNGFAEPLHRNAPTLLNLEQRATFNWSSPDLITLTDQFRGPLFNDHPDEMGFYRDTAAILLRFSADNTYLDLLKNCNASKITYGLVNESLKTYIGHLTSRKSRYDRFTQDKDSLLLSALERKGLSLFFSERAKCNVCHGGLDFFLPQVGDSMYASISDKSIRIPTLRNVSLTAPYFHDGRELTLGQSIQSHFTSCNECDPRLENVKLSVNEVKYLTAFLYTLTDTTYLFDPYFLSPFAF